MSEVLAEIWHVLEQASDDPIDLLRTPVLGTAGPGGCALRTVVLRTARAAGRMLICYSDARAPKIAQIKSNPQTQGLFYHHEWKIQMRAEGAAAVHHLDRLAREAWEAAPFEHRSNYCSSQPPGAEIAAGNLSSASAKSGKSPTQEESEVGFANFAVIVAKVDQIDWLQLTKNGNRRAGFIWDGIQFKGRWLAA